MFGNLGIHVIEYPTGRFGFVGSLPPVLATVIPATTADIMGGRAFSTPAGTMTLKFPSFATKQDAIAFAAEHGLTVR